MRADPVPSPETTGTGETTPVRTTWDVGTYLRYVGAESLGETLQYIAPWQARTIARELARLRSALVDAPRGAGMAEPPEEPAWLRTLMAEPCLTNHCEHLDRAACQSDLATALRTAFHEYMSDVNVGAFVRAFHAAAPAAADDAERDVIAVLRECVDRGHGPMLTPEEAAALLAMVERRASLLPPYEYAVKLELPETAAVDRDTSLVNLKSGDRVRQHIMGYGGREVHVYEIVRGYEYELAAKRAAASPERAP